MALPKFSLAAQKIWVVQNLGGLQPPSSPRPVRLWTQHNLILVFLTPHQCSVTVSFELTPSVEQSIASPFCFLLGWQSKIENAFLSRVCTASYMMNWVHPLNKLALATPRLLSLDRRNVFKKWVVFLDLDNKDDAIDEGWVCQEARHIVMDVWLL